MPENSDYIKDENGNVLGIWLRDPNDVKKSGVVEPLLMFFPNLLDRYINKKYRIEPNTLDSSGGCFVLFDDQ